MSYDLVDKTIDMYNNDLSSPEISDKISKEPEESTDSTQLLQPQINDLISFDNKYHITNLFNNYRSGILLVICNQQLQITLHTIQTKTIVKILAIVKIQ